MMELRIGSRAAMIVAVIGLVYIAVLAVAFTRFGLDQPITDPILFVMEVLTLVSAPPMVITAAAVHLHARAERKIFSMSAFAFITIFAGLTSAVHFVELTAARQMGDAGIVWPSTGYAAELLAWDWFLGLGLVSAGLAFIDEGPERSVRRALLISGFLALIGTVGPLTGDMGLQRIGIVGYAVAMPAAFFILSRFLRRLD